MGVPFAERVREAWLSSWKNQKRPQSDHVLTFVHRHETEVRLKAMMGRPAEGFLHDDALRGNLIAIYDLLAKSARLGASLGFRVHKVKVRDIPVTAGLGVSLDQHSIDKYRIL